MNIKFSKPKRFLVPCLPYNVKKKLEGFFFYLDPNKQITKIYLNNFGVIPKKADLVYLVWDNSAKEGRLFSVNKSKSGEVTSESDIVGPYHYWAIKQNSFAYVKRYIYGFTNTNDITFSVYMIDSSIGDKVASIDNDNKYVPIIIAEINTDVIQPDEAFKKLYDNPYYIDITNNPKFSEIALIKHCQEVKDLEKSFD